MTNTATSQLRQRMIEDMTLRGFALWRDPGPERCERGYDDRP